MAYSNIKDPSAHFHTEIYTANNGYSVTVTNDAHAGNFKPDFLWVKERASPGGYDYDHNLFDSTRGVTKVLWSNSTAAEMTASQSNYDLQSFNTNGFTTGSPESTNSLGGANTTNGKVAWQWVANGGTTSSNTDGDITSTVQANQDAGFSIVTYTGNTSNNQTVGHGLGAKPGIIIIRNRSRVENWRLNNHAINNGIGMAIWDNDSAYNTTGTTLMNVAATSSVFNVSTDWSVNGGYPFVAYCWAEKQGYSKFSSYVGNANANGPFVYTGFKPAWIMLKKVGAGDGWFLLDGARNPTNTSTNGVLRADQSGAEGSASKLLDMVSNGFKLRGTDGAYNGSGNTYFYMAFAENPFVAGGIPTTAR